MIKLEGITIDEICAELKLPFKTVETRIQRAGIKPITRQAIYPHETLEIVRNVKMGRPKKTATKPQIKPKAKPKKT